MTKRTLPIPLLLSVILAGCGLSDPYSQQPQKAPVRQPSVPVRRAPARTGTPDSVIAQFAAAWVNWTYATLPREREELLTLATGTLADELRQDAAQAVKARLLEVSEAYSRGRYVGAIQQHGGQVIVVTYEEVAPDGGQAQAAYQVYLARTQYTASGWRLIEWQPAIDG